MCTVHTHRVSAPQKPKQIIKSHSSGCLTDKVARVLSMCRSDDKASVGLELEIVEAPRGFSRMVLCRYDSRQGSIVSTQWSLLCYFMLGGQEEGTRVGRRWYSIVLRTRKVAWFTKLSQTRRVIIYPWYYILSAGIVFWLWYCGSSILGWAVVVLHMIPMGEALFVWSASGWNSSIECIGAPDCHLLLMRVECCIYPQFGTGTEEKEWVGFVFVCQYGNTRPPPQLS